MRTLAALLVLFAALASATAAHAQLDEARRQLAQADFARAIRAFDRAERGAHLAHDDLVAIYEGRAMARWATGREREAERDLAALAELDPHHGFPPEAPPELATAFDEAAREGGLALEITFADDEGATTVNVDAQRDRAGLVRSIRLHTRVDGGGWSTADASAARLVVPDHAIVEVWVEALGPGGAILAHAGTADAPITHGGGPVHELVEPTAPTRSQPSLYVHDDQPAAHDDLPLYIGIGVGVGVLVIAAVIIGVAVGVSSGPSDQTQPGAPVVRF